MRPKKLSSNVFLEFPPILSHYLEADRNLWIDGNPKRGRISMLNRSGRFVELEAMAVERRQLYQLLGPIRVRSLTYRTGFEQGRRDAVRHYQSFSENARLALQAALVFGQLQGKFTVEPVRFEFDLDERSLYRELLCTSCAEAVVHRMTLADTDGPVCWSTAGYLSGHVSEILGHPVVTMETECIAAGGKVCRFISRLNHEFGDEAAWVRDAMVMKSVDDELEKGSRLVASAQKAARRAQALVSGMSKKSPPIAASRPKEIIGGSEAMQPVVRRMRHLSTSKAPILLTGEPGTGKEALARSIHMESERKARPFVLFDCQAMEPSQIANELFGAEPGTSPGRVGAKGAYAAAEGGTLFISDLAYLNRESQGRLLQLMQTDAPSSEMNDEAPSEADVRIVTGLELDPEDAMAQGLLREDLYYAFALGRIDVPPLRERGPDILRLAERFLSELRTRNARANLAMSDDFKDMLMGCAWPGNVRQLRNVLEHAAIMSNEDLLVPGVLPDEVLSDRWNREPRELTEDVIRAALNRTHNNRSKAAELLGVGRTTLWRAMKRLNVA